MQILASVEMGARCFRLGTSAGSRTGTRTMHICRLTLISKPRKSAICLMNDEMYRFKFSIVKYTCLKLVLANTKYTQQKLSWVMHKKMFTTNLLALAQLFKRGAPSSKHCSTVSAKSESTFRPRIVLTRSEHFSYKHFVIIAI